MKSYVWIIILASSIILTALLSSLITYFVLHEDEASHEDGSFPDDGTITPEEWLDQINPNESSDNRYLDYDDGDHVRIRGAISELSESDGEYTIKMNNTEFSTGLDCSSYQKGDVVIITIKIAYVEEQKMFGVVVVQAGEGFMVKDIEYVWDLDDHSK